MTGAQARQIVKEHHIQYPMQAIFDAPVATHDLGEGFGIEFC
jgi:hypothetical protein